MTRHSGAAVRRGMGFDPDQKKRDRREVRLTILTPPAAEVLQSVGTGGESTRLRQPGQPLAIVSRDGIYPWGKSELACPEHSDFLLLQDQLLRVHPQSLIDQTDTKYKSYRAQRKRSEKARQDKENAERNRARNCLAFLTLFIFMALTCILLYMHSLKPQVGPARPSSVYIKNSSLSLGSKPTDLKSLVSVYADPHADYEDLELNVSVRHGQLKVRSCSLDDCPCNTSLPGILLLDQKLDLKTSPKTAEGCVGALQYQAGPAVRVGQDIIELSYKTAPHDKSLQSSVPVSLQAAAVASKSRLEGSLLLADAPAGTPSDLKVFAHDGLDHELSTGGDVCRLHVLGRLSNASSVHENITYDLRDNGDGTYFTAVVRPYGKYEVIVQINGHMTAPRTVHSRDAASELELRKCTADLDTCLSSSSNLTFMSSQTWTRLQETTTSQESCQKDLNESQWSKFHAD